MEDGFFWGQVMTKEKSSMVCFTEPHGTHESASDPKGVVLVL